MEFVHHFHFELFDISILCICATNLCNTNLTTCKSSADNQIKTNSAPSSLPSFMHDLSTNISCIDTTSSSDDNSSNISSYCSGSASPYIDVEKCNQYVIDNTVLCVYYAYGSTQTLTPLTADHYKMYLSTIRSTINQDSLDSSIDLYYNESSSYLYINTNLTINDQPRIVKRCICASDNCNYNLATCLNSNRSISIENSATSKVFLFFLQTF